MKSRLVAVAMLAFALGVAAAQDNATNPPAQSQTPGGGMGRGQGGGRGWGGFGQGRGVMGTVTEAGSDHYTIKTEMGESYTVHFSANTRLIKQPAQRTNQQDGMRVPPEEIKAGDIHVGDVIAAMGEVDATNKSVGAMSVIKLDPERAKQMQEMQANFGKTWLMGKVTSINETKVTLQSPVDNAAHTFVADENTTFRRRREPVTLADLEVGQNVRVEGAVKDGVFTASTVMFMLPPATGGPAPRPGPPPQ